MGFPPTALSRFLPMAFLVTATSTLSSAEVDVVAPTTTVVDPVQPYFIAAMIAGVLLALGFQLLLTTLSAAIGISMAGRLDETSGDSSPSDGSDGDSHYRDGQPARGPLPMVRKINHAFGAWATITASLACFFAAWMAVAMTGLEGGIVPLLPAIATGLAIWALFLVLLMALEVSCVSSALGSLVRVATTGIRGVASGVSDGVSGLFQRSQVKQVGKEAEEATRRIKDELFNDVNTRKVQRRLEDYIDRLAPEPLDYQAVRREMAKLLDRTEFEAILSEPWESEDGRAHLDLHAEADRGFVSPETNRNKRRARQIVDRFRQDTANGKGQSEAAFDAVAAQLGGEDRAEATRERLEDFLRRTDDPDLQPEDLKREIDTMLEDPGTGWQLLSARLRRLDGDSLLRLYSSATGRDSEDARGRMQQVRERISMVREQLRQRLSEARQRAEAKIEERLVALEEQDPELAGLSDDVMVLFDDPGAGWQQLKERAQALDREQIVAILSRHSNYDEADINRLANRIEDVRNDVLKRAERMRDELQRRTDEVKAESKKQAEEFRRVAAVASGWSFTAASLSGVAAALGAWIATIT